MSAVVGRRRTTAVTLSCVAVLVASALLVVAVNVATLIIFTVSTTSLATTLWFTHLRDLVRRHENDVD